MVFVEEPNVTTVSLGPVGESEPALRRLAEA
jgi:hypothetical protein